MTRRGLIRVAALVVLVTAGAAAPGRASSPAGDDAGTRAESSRTRSGRTAKRVDLPRDMALIPATVHVPLYPLAEGEDEIPLDAFLLDKVPVTNAEFLAFVKRNPRWRKGSVPAVFATEGYLRHWESADTLGPDAPPRAPVVAVSWFAARAFCAAQGKRLPTESEWEVAGAASATAPNARDSVEFRQTILSWYAKPTPKRHPPVGQGPANYYGIHDLHGLVWEWVEDFNGNFATVDSRTRDQESGPRFCGAAGLESLDNEDYANFMRSAFRGSLEARYTGTGLGFRCARSVPLEDSE